MRTDGPTDLTKLIVAFRNLANAPKDTCVCVDACVCVCVCVCVFVSHLLNYFTDVDGTVYESCATGGHLSAVRFYSLHSSRQTRERVR